MYFPYFVVEQTRGWSTIQPPLPTQFRIRDAHKRAIEFLLDLDAHRIALRRQEVLLQKIRIETEWTAQLNHLTGVVESTNAVVQAMPRTPTSTWPPLVPPSVVVPSGREWISLDKQVAERTAQLNRLVEREIPRVQEIALSTQADLEEAERDVRDKQTLLARVLDALELEQQEVIRIEQRIGAIDEDIQRNKDVQTLKKLGSRQGSSLDAGNCPICHQPVHDSLVPLDANQPVMTVDENIEFLTEQRRTFEVVLANARRVVEARSSQTRALNQELATLRESVRTLRQTLVSDGRMPSAAAIRMRIELENSIQRDEHIIAQFDKYMGRFGELSAQWRSVQQDLLALPRNDVTDADRKKISKWAALIREQLSKYEFKSFSVAQVVVSEDSYRPEHEGFDMQASIGQANGQASASLQTSISASDLIRTIWSYLHGMLELARTEKTNHPGCIIFDEPRQQSTRDVSFAALLTRSSKALESGQQVILFTSENLTRLESYLEPLPHSLKTISGRVLKRGLAAI